MSRRYLISIFVLVLLVVGFGLYQWERVHEYPVNVELSQTQTDEIQKVLKDVQQSLQVEAPITLSTPLTTEWKTSSGTIPLTGYSFVLGGMKNDYIGEYKPVKAEEVTEVFIKELSVKVNEAFVEEGLIKNTDNIKSEFGGFVGLIDAYEKSDIYCKVDYYIQSDPFAYFFCGVYDPIAQKWQQKFAKPVNPENDPNILIEVTKVVGPYASVNIHGRDGGGAFVWLVRQFGSWKKVFTGQDIPECALVDKYKIPKEIFGNCYDSKTNKSRFDDTLPQG